MEYQFTIMTQEQAEYIAFTWHYEGEYSFYDMEADKEDLAEFLNPETRGETTFAVIKEEELIGFLSVMKMGRNIADIGLGLKPALTGRGMGSPFLEAAIDFVMTEFQAEKITLSVAAFNQRAIKVYRNIGFEEVGIMMQETNGGTFEFLKMELNIKQ